MALDLVWADDDSGPTKTLGAFRGILRRRGLNVLAASSYQSAHKILEDGSKKGGTIRALLADVILPHSDNSGALNPRLGLVLAERGVPLGLKRIGFLTVVPFDEIADQFTKLDDSDPEVQVRYFSKAELLEPGFVDQIVEFFVGSAT